MSIQDSLHCGNSMKHEISDQRHTDVSGHEAHGKEESALESLQKFCEVDLELLNRNQREQPGSSSIRKMDVGRKQNNENISPEPKKESRLTSIIDQLRISKTKDAGQSDTVNKQSGKPNSNSPWTQ
ncbi:hypothetical protein X975_13832, partial [Stegodyphus mimosarum]